MTYCARMEARQPYTDGVYMLPFWLDMSREALVFCSNISVLAFMKAFSTSRSKYVSSAFTSLGQNHNNVIEAIRQMAKKLSSQNKFY